MMDQSNQIEKFFDGVCPVCSSSLHDLVITVAIQDYTVMRCGECNMLHLNPMPSEKSLSDIYQDPSYFKGQERPSYQDYEALRKVIVPHSKRRLRRIESYFPTPGRLLDFGCAAGYFLQVAQNEGWKVSGIELSPDMAERASKALNVPVVSSVDILSEEKFEVITLWEVLEHLPDPVKELSRLYDLLGPGGMLVLSTPNAGHWQVQREPENWDGFRPIPSHVLFFTEATLRGVLERAGFERISVFRVAPLPPLPPWLRRLSAPLGRRLSVGNARAWPLALLAWRAIRVFGWGWQKIAHPEDDIFATIEVIAFKRQDKG